VSRTDKFHPYSQPLFYLVCEFRDVYNGSEGGTAMDVGFHDLKRTCQVTAESSATLGLNERKMTPRLLEKGFSDELVSSPWGY